jgi:hypothetical protein
LKPAADLTVFHHLHHDPPLTKTAGYSLRQTLGHHLAALTAHLSSAESLQAEVPEVMALNLPVGVTDLDLHAHMEQVPMPRRQVRPVSWSSQPTMESLDCEGDYDACHAADSSA